MLTNNFSKSLTLRNDIKLGDKVIKGMTATINGANPDDITFSEWTNDKALYKEHRVAIRQLEAEFEEAAYAEYHRDHRLCRAGAERVRPLDGGPAAQPAGAGKGCFYRRKPQSDRPRPGRRLPSSFSVDGTQTYHGTGPRDH